ncbi:MAG: aldose epimerase family protein [Treponema sp.]
MKLKKAKFGIMSDGTKVHLYTVSNGKMSFSVTDYGCTLTSIILPAKNNTTVDALLGYSSFEGYLNSGYCFGTVVGRFANRIGGASFTLDGKKFNLDKNDGENTLHGGFDRYEKKMWKAKEVRTSAGLGVQFTRKSYDGEQGFPGNVKIKVTYTLNENNTITLDYKATSDKSTPINLTNHAYFNLRGYNGGSVLDQELQLDCNEYLEVDSGLIPTGKKIKVEGNAFDFTKAKLIGKDFAEVGSGYDHCFCLSNPNSNEPVKFATVKDPESGRKMNVSTTLPGVQFYSANWIDGIQGKQGFVYHNHDALCLETEGFPDSPNKESFPSTILHPGEEYHQITEYNFEF